MNDTVVVQRSILSDMYESLVNIKAKIAFVGNTNINLISNDVDYGIYLISEDIIEDIMSLQNILITIRELN